MLLILNNMQFFLQDIQSIVLDTFLRFSDAEIKVTISDT